MRVRRHNGGSCWLEAPDAVLSKDLTLIMGVVLVYSAILILFNLVVDVVYRWVDPRIEVA